jgi:hypothetical protein
MNTLLCCWKCFLILSSCAELYAEYRSEDHITTSPLVDKPDENKRKKQRPGKAYFAALGVYREAERRALELVIHRVVHVFRLCFLHFVS